MIISFKDKVKNVVFFNAVWLACILGAAYGHIWISLLVTIAFITWQLRAKQNYFADGVLIAVCLILGFILDSTWLIRGYIRYASGEFFAPLPPLWILCLWAGFAMTFNYSLNWIKHRYVLAFLFGLIGSPLSYFSAYKLGAVEFLQPEAFFVYMPFAWAGFMLFIAWFIGFLERVNILGIKSIHQDALEKESRL